MKAGEKTHIVIKFLYDMGHYNIAKRIEDVLQYEEKIQQYEKMLQEKQLEIQFIRNRNDELNGQIHLMKQMMEKINGRESISLASGR